jgi:hypothetical protein
VLSDNGTTALIGAPNDEAPNGEDSGSAYVFRRSDGSWRQQQKLAAADGNEDDEFGQSVALSADGATVLIGASEDEGPRGLFTGSAYVFTRSDGEWIQQQKLRAPDANDRDRFGFSISLSASGATALITAPTDENPNGENAGSAYVFRRSGGEWRPQQKLFAGDGDSEDLFGFSAALSADGTTAVLSASSDEDPNGRDAGSAYVFTRSNGEWSQQQKLTAADGNEEDGFGDSVALAADGTTALIGADLDRDPNRELAGSAYVFTRAQGADGWSQQQKLSAGDGGGDLGDSVALSADGATALIGAPTNDQNGGFAGAAYVFKRSDGGWRQQQKLTATDGDSGDEFGMSVALADNGVTGIVGAPTDKNANGVNELGSGAGSSYVFSSDDAPTESSPSPSVRVTGQQAGPPGGQASVTYELTAGEQEPVTLAFTLPSALSLTPPASETSVGSLSFNTARQQVVFSPPDGELTPAVVPTVTIRFDIAAGLSPPTTVEVDTAVLDATETTTDRVTTTLEITADSPDSPLSGTAGEYDTSGDGTITARELGAAVTDFGQGELNARELGEVVTAFGQS